MAQAPKPPEPPAPMPPVPAVHKSTRASSVYDTPNENCEHETVADEQRRRSDEAQVAAVQQAKKDARPA